MAKMSKALLGWRAKQEPGKVMKPSTFAAIKRRAAARGATDPTKVAGAAYWTTAKAKFRQKSAPLSSLRGKR